MAAHVPVCDIDDSLVEKVKNFRFNDWKKITAIVLKIDRENQKVVLDEELEDIDSIEDLQAELPESQPRYILLSYVYHHDDGRVSYPLCFIFISPQGCQPDLTMMYAGTKHGLVDFTKITKVFEIRNLEDLTTDFIKEKLAYFR